MTLHTLPAGLEPHKKLNWRARFRRVLLAGLFVLTPVALTIFVLRQLLQLMDGTFEPVIRWLDTELGFRPVGLGVVFTFLIVMFLGWLSTKVLGRRVLHIMERIIDRIPVARSVYSGTKGILEAVSQDQAEAFKRVVIIEYPKSKIYALAFVTGGARWGVLDDQLSDLLLVFVPTTPNPTSGFLLLVPRRDAIDTTITVEDGLRMVISGGILLPKFRAPKRPTTTRNRRRRKFRPPPRPGRRYPARRRVRDW